MRSPLTILWVPLTLAAIGFGAAAWSAEEESVTLPAGAEHILPEDRMGTPAVLRLSATPESAPAAPVAEPPVNAAVSPTASAPLPPPVAVARGPSRRIASGPSRVKRRIASEPVTEKTETRTEERALEEASGTGWAAYLGAGTGYLWVRPQSGSAEPDKAGQTFHGRLSLALINPRLVLEGGLGWLQSRVEGGGAAKLGSYSGYAATSVFTRAGSAEFSPRYRITPRFDAGPHVFALFGTNADFHSGSSGTTSPIFLGAQSSVFWDRGDYHLRLVGRGAMSVSMPQRNAYTLSIGFEIGLPLVRGRTQLRETRITTVREKREKEFIETETPIVEEVVREVVKFSFDDELVNFEFDRAELLPHSKEFIDGLGRYLAANPASWERVTIDGHTDKRGTAEYNEDLSQRRAAAVVALLEQAGLPAERLAAQGHGFGRQIDSADSDLAHARNRRVEMRFEGVKDAAGLREEIQRLRRATAIPDTCRDGRCR